MFQHKSFDQIHRGAQPAKRPPQQSIYRIWESTLARNVKAQFLNLCCHSSHLVPLEVNLQYLAKAAMCNKTTADHWNPYISLLQSSEKMAGGFPSASVYTKTLMKSVDVPRQFSHIHDCFSTHSKDWFYLVLLESNHEMYWLENLNAWKRNIC